MEEILNVVIVGHLDHGKSTFIGRLLYDTNYLPKQKIKEVTEVSKKLKKKLQFAYFIDHFKEERTKDMTIDTSQIFFKTKKRKYVIIDVPGQINWLKNMLTGAAQAEVGILILDAKEGIKEQTKRHCFLLKMIGVEQIVALINKMDLLSYSESKFINIRNKLNDLLAKLKITPLSILPISAKYGDNIVKRNKNLKWFDGPTVLEALDSFNKLKIEKKDLRFPVQDVYKIADREIAVGRIESGQMKKGQELFIMPRNTKTTLLEIWKFPKKNIKKAQAGECVGLILNKHVSRGEVLTKKPCKVSKSIRTNLFWFADEPYPPQKTIIFKCLTQESKAKIEKIFWHFDFSKLTTTKGKKTIKPTDIVQVEISLNKPVVIDKFSEIPETGRFVLEMDGKNVAAGIAC